jgi:TRAP-type C4-dicarboxylate transport system substrate-binding protein
VLELPMLLRSTEELDAIRGALAGEFGAAFQQRGYQLLGWGDLGWIRLFSVRPVRSLADLKRMRIWSWTDDPVARAMVKRFGVRGVPLGVQDVLPALETGIIDAAYGSPYVMLALQWHTKIRFIWRDNITYAMGALVVRRKAFQSLPPRLRQILEEESRLAARQLVRQSRDDNRRALARLRELHVEELPMPPEIMARFQQMARPLWQDLSGSLYPRPLLDKVLRLLAELRSR